MDDYNTTTPTQQLNGLLGGDAGGSLIPESLQVFLIISFVVLNILGIIFMIYWVMGMIRRWKVQTAILHMQKDIAEIKQSLAKTPETTPPPQSVITEPQVTKPTSETPTL